MGEELNFEFLNEMERTGLIVGDPSTYYAEQQAAYLLLDLRDGSVSTETECQCQNAVSSDVWHGIVLRFPLPRGVDAEQVYHACEENRSLFERILDGSDFVQDRDGNTIGEQDEDAMDARRELGEILESEDLQLYSPDGACVGYVCARDWAQGNPTLGYSDAEIASLTDDEIEQIAAEEEALDRHELRVIPDWVSYLTETRDELRGRLAENGEDS